MKRVAIALVALLTLCGCALHEQRANAIAGQLRDLPGVVYVLASGHDGSVWSPGSGMTVRVDVDPLISVVDATRIVETWIEAGGSLDSSSRFSMSAESTLAPEVPLGDHSIYLEHGGLDREQAIAATTLWASLLPRADSVVVFLEDDSGVIDVTSSRAVDAAGLADLVDEVARIAGTELAELDWAIGSSVTTDDESGVAVYSTGLPHADLLALVGRLDAAIATASLGGSYQVTVGASAESDAAYLVSVVLDPDDLRNTPSNQVEGLILTSSSWLAAQAFADALTAEDDIELRLSVFSDGAFATLLTTACEQSSRGAYSAELWSYWSHSCG